jgi:SAM-dependent methyltransferase
MSTAQIADRPRTLSAAEVDELDRYAFFAVLGKRVIHPGGRTATDELIRKADFQPGQHVLDVGCGVGTTAIEITRRFATDVTAIDIAPLMLERAAANVRAAGLQDRVSVEPGDIIATRDTRHQPGHLARITQSRHRAAHHGGTVGKTFVVQEAVRSHHVEWARVPYLGFILVTGTKLSGIQGS